MTSRCPTVCRTPTLAIALVGVIAASGVLMACESSQPGVVPAQKRAAEVVPQHDAYAKFGYRVDWRGFPTMTEGQQLARIEILGDAIAVQESGSVVTVLEARSGERRWSDPVASPLTKFVGIVRDGKKIIVSSESEAFFYDADTGALLSKQELAMVVNTRPTQVGPILVYGCSSGQVLGHLMLNGFRQWGSYMTGAIEVDPVLMNKDGVVGLVSTGGDVLILDGSHGFAFGRNKMFGGTNVPLAASESMLFVASTDHSLYGFNREGASQIWRKRTDAPLNFAPTYHDGKVYCDMGETGLTCFEAITGKEIWTSGKVHGTVLAMRSKRLVVWDGATATLADPSNGAVVETAKLDKVSMIKTDNFVDGNLYLGAPTGVVTKLAPRN